MTFLEIFLYISKKCKTKNNFIIFSLIYKNSKLVKNEYDFSTLRNKKTDINMDNLNSDIKKYLKGYPIELITNKVYFFNNEFLLNNGVFIPRNETELLVEEALSISKKKKSPMVIDLCCGSGVIGITYKLNKKSCYLILVDNSAKAIENTKRNLIHNNVKAEVNKSDCIKYLKKINFPIDVILCNPPYIDKSDENLNEESKKFNPKKSLYAKDNGLYFYKKILDIGLKKLSKNGFIVFEIGFHQKQILNSILKKKYSHFKWYFKKDYSNNDRILIVKNENI